MCYRSNIDVLECFHSDIAEYYRKHSEIDEFKDVVESTMTKDGETVLRFFSDGKKQYIGSAYYYKKDLQSVVDDCKDINDYAVLMIYGFGTGLIIKDIMKSLPKHITYVVLEPSVELFSYVIANIDISDILSEERLKLYICGINSDNLDKVLWDELEESNYRISRTISLPRYKVIFPERYNEFLDIYYTHIEHCASDIVSGQFHSYRDVENDIYNLQHVFNCCCIDQFVGSFPVEYPAVIISAGPSLEKNAEYIRELKNKLLLVAVDSALPYLLSINIIPDLAVSVSPNKDEVLTELYDTKDIDNIPFAIDTSVTYRGIKKLLNSKLIYISSSSPYYKDLFRLNNHQIDKLDSGGSVSSIAFSLLYEWGYRSFVFAGLDLALSDEKLYAGTQINDCNAGADRLVVEGYYGDKVYTLNTYKLHLEWFESVARSHQEINMYNATEGGAMIHGMKNCSMKNIADKYRNISYNYAKIIEEMDCAFSEDTKRIIYNRYMYSIDNLKKLNKLFGRACKLMETIFSMLSSGEGRNNNVVLDKHNEVNNIISICMQLPESYYLERIVGDKHNAILEDIYISDDDPNDEYRRILNKLYEYCKDMGRSVDKVKGLYTNMIDNIDKDFFENANNQKDELNDIYAANLSILNELYGIDTLKIDNIEGKRLGYSAIIPETEVARNGMLITLVNYEGKKIYLNSRYNPEEEAGKFVSQYKDISDYSVLMFFGFGNGTVARKLLEVLGDHVSLIFYEPYPELFVHVIHNYNITDIIDNPRLRVFISGINDEDFDIYMHSIITEANYRYTFYDALPKYKMLCMNSFEVMYKRFGDAVQSIRNNIETVKYQSGVDSQNNIMNLEYLKNCSCEEQLRGLFPTELPVVLVAAGPSLKKNINDLKRLKGKLLIIAVDTVAKYLVTNNVRPDIVVTVDPYLKNVVLQGIDYENLIYAYSSGASYEVLKSVGEGRKIIISSRSAYYDKIMGLSGHHMYQLNGGGSVATIAFSLAQSLGYTQYILVGQDLAFENGKRYADDDLEAIDNRNDFQLVEGYYGGEVYSPRDLRLYLDWYEMMARSYPEFTIINATEGGARIKGTVQKKLVDIVEEYTKVSYNYEDMINCQEPLFVGHKYEMLLEYISGSIGRLSDMKDKLSKGEGLINFAISQLDEYGIHSVNIRNVHDDINEIISDCAEMDESYFVDGVIADKQADVLADIYEQNTDPKEEYIRILNKLKAYVVDMLEAVDEVICMFRNTLDNMM